MSGLMPHPWPARSPDQTKRTPSRRRTGTVRNVPATGSPVRRGSSGRPAAPGSGSARPGQTAQPGGAREVRVRAEQRALPSARVAERLRRRRLDDHPGGAVGAHPDQTGVGADVSRLHAPGRLRPPGAGERRRRAEAVGRVRAADAAREPRSTLRRPGRDGGTWMRLQGLDPASGQCHTYWGAAAGTQTRVNNRPPWAGPTRRRPAPRGRRAASRLTPRPDRLRHQPNARPDPGGWHVGVPQHQAHRFPASTPGSVCAYPVSARTAYPVSARTATPAEATRARRRSAGRTAPGSPR